MDEVQSYSEGTVLCLQIVSKKRLNVSFLLNGITKTINNQFIMINKNSLMIERGYEQECITSGIARENSF